MSKYSAHIKQESLRNIVLQEADCDTKLNQIRNLIGLPPSIEEPEKQVEKEPEQEAEKSLDLKSDSVKSILDGLEGKELATGRSLVNYMRQVDINWDPSTLELIVSGKSIPHSNLSLLVKKVVHQSSPVIPVGLVTYLNELLLKKVPITYIRDSDSLNIREALLTILKRQESIGVPNKPQEETSGSNLEVSEGQKSLKRAREDSGDESLEYSEEKKKRKIDEEGGITEGEDRKDSEESEERQAISPKRRSARILKKNLQQNWTEFGK